MTRRGFWVGVVLGWATILGLAILGACGEGLTRPTSDERATWRGTPVVGKRAADAVPLLEDGWRARTREMGPAEPPGPAWTIYIYDTVAIEACGGDCGGLTNFKRKEILLAWPEGPQRLGDYGDGRWFLRQLASHEFCHYIHGRRGTGSSGEYREAGPGCTDRAGGNTWP